MNSDWEKRTGIFEAARDFEPACARAAAAGDLVLCRTARLARRILHVCRTEKLRSGATGWETPDVKAFSGWVRERYETLWEERRPLGRCAADRLWHEAARDVAVPEGLAPGPRLYGELQSSLDILLDNGLDPCGRETGHALADFRRSVTRRYLELLDEREFVSWPGMIEAVGAAVQSGMTVVPGSRRVVLAGFDVLSPREVRLLDLLAGKAAVESLRAAAGLDSAARVRVYAGPEQECAAACAEMLASWNGGVCDTGLVFLDNAYFPLVKRLMDELAGEDRPEFEKAIRYNLTRGALLSEHPLFQAAILPLRAAVEPVPGRCLASLFTSPYVRKSTGESDETLRAVLWDADTPPPLAVALMKLGSAFPVSGMVSLASTKRTKLSGWLAMLDASLREMGFPRLEGTQRTTDALAMRHLDEIVHELSREAGELGMDAGGALSWLKEAAGRVAVSEKTSELAGIQILNAAESRGLAFERLWIVGAHGRALPAPARDLPFLDPDERRRVAGGSPESCWELAQRSLASLCAAAPKLEFSRAAADGEDAPFLPCPLVPDKTGEDGKLFRHVLDLWRDAPREWSRAKWLWKGRMRGDKAMKPLEKTVRGRGLDEEISVTALRDLVACPFMFFCGHVLNLAPLEEPGSGIDPALRGRVIHAILKNVVDGLPGKAPGWPEDLNSAFASVCEAARKELAKQPDNLFWRVEKTRLLGANGSGGVFRAWLEAERTRARALWRFAGTELDFKGLNVGGIKVRGRVDRVDFHDGNGFAVWDYKTGERPGDARVIAEYGEPQLPAYALALRRGLLGELHGKDRVGDPRTAPVQMGYISLKSAAKVEVRAIGRDRLDFDSWSPAWERAISARVDPARRGVFDAEPDPAPRASFSKRQGACRYCEFYNMCGYFDSAVGATPGEPADEEDAE